MTRSFLDWEMERIMIQFSWKSLNLSFLLHYSNINTLTNPPWVQIKFFFESIGERLCLFCASWNMYHETVFLRHDHCKEFFLWMHTVSLPGILKALRNPAVRKHDSCCSTKLYCDRHYYSHLYSPLCSYNPDLFRATTCPAKEPCFSAFLVAREGQVTWF